MIQVGDLVYWYESGSVGRKNGQVMAIRYEYADVFCPKDNKTYSVLISKLTKV